MDENDLPKDTPAFTYMEINSEDIPTLVKRIAKAADAKRICVYSAVPEWTLIAQEGEQGDSAEEIKAIKQNKDSGNVHFIPLINNANEQVGAIGFSGNLDNAELYSKLIGTMINTTNKQEVEIGEIIDSAKAALTSAAGAIDLGENIYKPTFTIENLNQAGLYKVVFKLFNRLGFFEAFQISNMCLYGFLRDYGLTKQNVDSFQFLAAEILQAHLERVCKKSQLMAAFMAALLSDFKADSYLLDESAEAVVKISRSISIMSNDQLNFFKSQNPTELKNIWALIVDFTIATDHSKHFEVIQAAKDQFEDESRQNDDADDSVSNEIIKLLLVCAKFAECARENPQENLMKTLSANFWKRCDLSKTSFADKKREDINPVDSLKELMEDAAKPAFELLSTIYPQLSSILLTLTSNIEKMEKSK